MKSFTNMKNPLLNENKVILKKFLTDFIKNEPNNTNKCFNYKTIYLSKIIIQGLFSQQSNYYFVSIFNKDIDFIQRKLFLLHIFFAYKNIYLKLSKSLENNENLFSLIFHEIILVPLIHNFDNVCKQLEKKIDLILFDNAEYITSLLIDLNSNEIICDLGNSFQKQYKASILQFQNRKEIIEELVFHGSHLKNNYVKTTDKKIDLIYNCKKIELRATFPKPLFIIKFLPTLQGTIIIHLFNQYKLAKVRRIDPMNPSTILYENYKEVDISFFNISSEIDEKHYCQIDFIEKFFFEYFLLLGNNIKEMNIKMNKINIPIMTYKNRDYNLLYLNKEIVKIMKNIIMEYFKDEKDLIYKLKNRFIQESNKNSSLNEGTLITKTERVDTFTNINDNNNYINNNNSNINQLEFTYNKFITEFYAIQSNNNNDFLKLNEINIFMPENFSNINEYSELNLTKENLNIVKRNVTTSKNNRTKSEFNVYSNSSFLDFNSMDKNGEREILNTNEPFISEATNIEYKVDLSKEESGFKSILLKK